MFIWYSSLHLFCQNNIKRICIISCLYLCTYSYTEERKAIQRKIKISFSSFHFSILLFYSVPFYSLVFTFSYVDTFFMSPFVWQVRYLTNSRLNLFEIQFSSHSLFRVIVNVRPFLFLWIRSSFQLRTKKYPFLEYMILIHIVIHVDFDTIHFHFSKEILFSFILLCDSMNSKHAHNIFYC